MYLKIRAVPDSKIDKIEEISSEVWRVFIKAPAERNLANERLIGLVANKINISFKNIRIVSGHHSPNKILSIPDDSFLHQKNLVL